MQVVVTRECFKPITVKFVIEDAEVLKKVVSDFAWLGDGNTGATYESTNSFCEEIAGQLSKFLED